MVRALTHLHKNRASAGKREELGGISGGTPKYDVKKPALIQVLGPLIRILFAHHPLFQERP
jgi:hypothetical protein